MRSTRLVSIVLAIAFGVLAVSGQGSSLSAPISSPAPAHLQAVTDTVSAQVAPQSVGSSGVTITAFVQSDLLPLALIGKDWSQEQRNAYIAQIHAAQDRLSTEVEALGGQVAARFTNASAGIAVEIDSAQTDKLQALGGVAAVMEVADYRVERDDADDDSIGNYVGSTQVHELGNDGSGINIAIIDSGVDYTHRKLGGPGTTDAYAIAYCGTPGLSVGDPACVANRQFPNATLFPNAKVHGGYDFVGDIWPNPDPRCGLDANDNPLVCPFPDFNPIDGEGHGTHVADIAAGLPSNPDAADSGIAPGATLWAFKACNGSQGQCSGVALLQALDRALDLDGSDQGLCNPALNPCLAYDPADIINLSISSAYGQPEDGLTLFVNIASYYGSLVVTAAGNDGDRPYIVGSPSTAAAAVSVGQSTSPSEPSYRLQADDTNVLVHLQPWSAPITGTVTGELQYGNGTGDNANGCAAFVNATGKILLTERGGCNLDTKTTNAAAAGAVLLVVADNLSTHTAPTLTGQVDTIPVTTITRFEADQLTAQLARATPVATVDGNNSLREDRVVASSSRGPRIADGSIKPDLLAPGAIVSAVAGSGDATALFSGTSGAAPVVAGTAALLAQELEEQGVLDPYPGLANADTLSLAPLFKALMMNTAQSNVLINGQVPAPITLQGAGRVDAFTAFRSRTVAWDITDLLRLVESDLDPTPEGCAYTPFIDIINYVFFGIRPPCATGFPFGDPLFRTWNAQAGSVSFGYNPISGFETRQRTLAVMNYSLHERSYDISTEFRYDNDKDRGVSVSVEPTHITIPAKSATLVTVTMELGARTMRDWTLNGGELGATGTNVFCGDPDSSETCPSLQLFEVDGFIRIDGGDRNTVRLPWQVLPKKVADTYVTGVEDDKVLLRNPARYKDSTADVFALVDVSPNKCDTLNNICDNVDYVPGIAPGIDYSPIDLHEVGVRGYEAPGLNVQFGLPPAPAGARNDEVVEFAITAYDKPYRASPNAPARFEVHIDNNRDGVTDYIVFNADSGGGRDGRSIVYVRDANPADGTTPQRAYLYTVVNFNTQNWILPVPAAAVGLRSDQPFDFRVLAFDAYFTGPAGYNGMWDCSPGVNGACTAAAHTFQIGQPAYTTEEREFVVPALGQYDLRYQRVDAGVATSPAQIGLLLMYRDAQIGKESASIDLR